MKYKIIIILLSVLFTLFSFIPQFLDLWERPKVPADRDFELVHNYMFDYNFYLSRIQQGMEGKWLVTEKYYNHPHPASLFQIIYLYFGKIGAVFHVSGAVIYHAMRLGFGTALLVLIGFWAGRIFSGWWPLVAYLLTVTAGSWPIIIKLENGNFRSATYMGWWSAIDSLQRITFIPHVLFGQILLLLFLYRYSMRWERKRLGRLIIWGILGTIGGIVFPPTIIITYVYFAFLTLFELADLFSTTGKKDPRVWFYSYGLSRVIFIIFSFPSLIYLAQMFKVMPWSALALFDIQHRIAIPYLEYAKALGPVLPLGLAGFILTIINREKKLFPFVCWIFSIVILFVVFERVPQQSPLRFTEGALHVPLGFFAAYFFYRIIKTGRRLGTFGKSIVKGTVISLMMLEIAVGLYVMWSMVGWITDQVYGKREGTWPVPLGAQLVFPLKDFMAGIEFLRTHTKGSDVVLTYITAGNYIPAYAGNYVYIGHANTPDEDKKEKIVADFFAGRMGKDEVKKFIQKERISYVYFGPQERELGKVTDLTSIYSFLSRVYENGRVIIYKVVI